MNDFQVTDYTLRSAYICSLPGEKKYLENAALNTENRTKCYLKCGFKDAGKLREKIFLNGKRYDELIMDILEDEFNGDFIKNENIK